MPDIADLLNGASQDEQQRSGCWHTAREICQQPATWIVTGEQMTAEREHLKKSIASAQSIVLSGSGSSEYAGECVRLTLQNELGTLTQAIASGTILSYGHDVLPPRRPGVMVWLARSGDSPESAGAMEVVLQTEPELRHIVLTCNANGALARRARETSGAAVVTLDERTNDRSLVMTSSFTNLVLAARSLGLLKAPERYREVCRALARIGAQILQRDIPALAEAAAGKFRRVIFLGDGARFGAAREGALKMLEMTAGRVSTVSETFLGLRHGPMSFADPETLLVCFLSSDPRLRPYQLDLLDELNRKQLGLGKIVVGEDIPARVQRASDIAVECAGLSAAGDENAAVLDVLVCQVLAFFRCLQEGLRPDSPSEQGIINRVVEQFPLHLPNGIHVEQA